MPVRAGFAVRVRVSIAARVRVMIALRVRVSAVPAFASLVPGYAGLNTRGEDTVSASWRAVRGAGDGLARVDNMVALAG